MSRERKRWQTISYRFQAGEEIFTRSFVETSPEKCQAVALAWAKQQGYRLLGPA